MSGFFNEIKNWPMNEKRAFAFCTMAVASSDGVINEKERIFLYKTHTDLLGFSSIEINEITKISQKENFLQKIYDVLKTMSDRKLENMAYMLIYLAKIDGVVHNKEIDLIKSFLLAAGYPNSVVNKIIEEGLNKIEGPK